MTKYEDAMLKMLIKLDEGKRASYISITVKYYAYAHSCSQT